MKWFMGLSGSTASFSGYSDLVKVAVHTAKKYTNLTPYFIYDGNEDDELPLWLKSNGVNVIFRESFYKKEIKEIADQKNNKEIFSIGSGAFLRCEIPDIMKECGFKDSYVLYTDCDVMFCKDVSLELETMRCKYFSVAPESNYTDYDSINTGVMLMNIKKLRKKEKRFKKFILSNLLRFTETTWDQTAYIEFYQKKKLRSTNRWDNLPQKYNYKPYWNEPNGADIIHFHGPKPFMAEDFKLGKGKEALLHLVNENYYSLCERWHQEFNEVNSILVNS